MRVRVAPTAVASRRIHIETRSTAVVIRKKSKTRFTPSSARFFSAVQLFSFVRDPLEPCRPLRPTDPYRAARRSLTHTEARAGATDPRSFKHTHVGVSYNTHTWPSPTVGVSYTTHTPGPALLCSELGARATISNC